ncbi:hypothetical protein NEF87_004340 [Candidatus Lokiarchaeum ossiferum]|uniref:Flagellar modification protein B n=1 Tax=Candidatus Lokiarchaeum ossiferum TaxID=2951803 RepID=A0ABY6HWZ9_9ARCH|nr:hypothetical protein NEF87_004340 [Candidatus Lokiarchaeum sp. B-35]
MYKNKKILATICARGGSQGVKGKNIRILGDKPLIIHSLNLVRESSLIDEYIISTDSQEIMEVVKKHGFDIHFKRPDFLASGKISRIDVIQHATKWVEENLDQKFDVIIDLGVATPLKNLEDMENSIKILIDEDASNVFSVNVASKSPYFNMVEFLDGKIQYVKKIEKKINDRRDSPQVYEMNDGFNVFKHEILFSDNPQFNENTKISIMPPHRSVDIDEEWDLLLAEFIISTKIKEEING